MIILIINITVTVMITMTISITTTLTINIMITKMINITIAIITMTIIMITIMKNITTYYNSYNKNAASRYTHLSLSLSHVLIEIHAIINLNKCGLTALFHLCV